MKRGVRKLARAGANLAAAAVVAALCGCAATTKITVHSSGRTNDGDPMYMAVRAWDGKPTSGERYQEVAARLFAEPPIRRSSPRSRSSRATTRPR